MYVVQVNYFDLKIKPFDFNLTLPPTPTRKFKIPSNNKETN